MARAHTDRIRSLCLALPEVTEKLSHGSPTFFVRKSFLMYVGTGYADGRDSFWAAAPIGAQTEMVAAEPDRFFRPPYVGHRGWVGVRLDGPDGDDLDWDEIAEIVTDAWRTVAPPALLRKLDEG